MLECRVDDWHSCGTRLEDGQFPFSSDHMSYSPRSIRALRALGLVSTDSDEHI